MAKEKDTYKYLLRLYSRVDEYLTTDEVKDDAFPDVIVFFCVVVERILKVKLHKKNPILVFDSSRFKDDNVLAIIAIGKEDNIETIKIRETIERFKVVFKNVFSEDELQALLDIYNTRNCFIHGYKADSRVVFNREDILKKMGTVWEKISTLAISLFGKSAIKQSKPKEKYTEEELEKVLIDEVIEKIKPQNTGLRWFEGANSANISVIDVGYHPWNSDRCPRCDSYNFSFEGNGNDSFSSMYSSVLSKWSIPPGAGFSGLYKCDKCHLELTPKEYEIAKKLKTAL